MPPLLAEIAQLVVNGVMAGTILAVPAIGLTAIYAVLRFPNFALASHATIGAFAGYICELQPGPADSAVRRVRVSGRRRGGRGERRGRAEAVPSPRIHH